MKKISTFWILFILAFISLRAQPVFTELVCNPHDVANPSEMTPYNNKTYFSCYHDSFGWELWVTDGTQNGTKLLKDIIPGTDGSNANTFIPYNGKLYFFATSGSNNRYELWETDGTANGTKSVSDLGGDADPPNYWTVYNNKIYLNLNDSASITRLWVSDGTKNGTKPMFAHNKKSGCNAPDEFITYKNKLYFSALNDSTGRELWVSDGTPAGTKMLKDIIPGNLPGMPTGFVLFNDKIAFRATTAAAGMELWMSDGTDTGTKMVKDINPGSGDGWPGYLTVYKNKLYFQAYTPSSREELWVSDGTANGTVLLKEIRTAFGSDPMFLTVFNNLLFFRAQDDLNGSELWVCDGTANGTKMLKNLNPGATGSNIYSFTPLGSKMYFTATNNPTTYAYTVFQTDGTDTGTKAIEPSTKTYAQPFDYLSFFRGFAVSNGSLYFPAWYTSKGVQLWRLHDTSSPNTGITETRSSFVKVYPNPALGQFIIELKNTEKASVQMFDMNGALLYSGEQQASGNSISVDVSDLSRGMYILSVETVYGTYREKVFKE